MAWRSTLLWPAGCVRVEVVVHRIPEEDTACVALELSNPHSRELLAKSVDPAVNAPGARGLAEEVAAQVEAALWGVWDPDPF